MRYVGTAAGAVAIASAGYYAYSKIQSHLAKTRMTEIGHAKAVAKYEEQASKMLNTFGEVKLSQITKK